MPIEISGTSLLMTGPCAHPGEAESLRRKGFAPNMLEPIPIAKVSNFGGICSMAAIRRRAKLGFAGLWMWTTLELGSVDSTHRALCNGNRCAIPEKGLTTSHSRRADMVFSRSKPPPRQDLAALLVLAGLAATPSFANPQMLTVSGPWSSRDYVEAIFAVHNGVITLPRQANPKTRALFARLIDRANIEALIAGPLGEAE